MRKSVFLVPTMGIEFNYFMIIFLMTVDWLSFGNTAEHVIRTRRQLNAVHKSDKDLRQNYVHQIFTKSSGNNTLLYLIGKALAEKNDEFNGLKSSKIDNVDAYLDVINRAFDENVDSVINITIVLKASHTKTSKPNTLTRINVPQKNPLRPTTVAAKDLPKKGDHVSTFERAVVDTHNDYRKKHDVDPLTFSPLISRVSQDWAENLAENDYMGHRPDGQYGENIYAIESTDLKFKITGNMPVDAWYSEIANYTFGKEPTVDVIMQTGHFTQLVWKGSRELGIGLAQSKSTNMYYVVCNYNPRGNMVGEFRQNVNPPQKVRRNNSPK